MQSKTKPTPPTSDPAPTPPASEPPASEPPASEPPAPIPDPALPPDGEPPGPVPAAVAKAFRETVAADAEIASVWKEVAKLKARAAAQRLQLIGLDAVAFRLDAFIDAIRPTLPSAAGDEADALKAAISELRS